MYLTRKKKHLIGNYERWATNQLIVAHDGSFITVGQGFDSINAQANFDSVDEFLPVGWIIRINPDGSLRWKRGFQYSRALDTINVTYTLLDVAELPGGDIVAVGECDSGSVYDPHHQQGWMVRVDSNGCFLPDCRQPNALSGIEAARISWKVAPNPVGSEMYVYFDAADAARYTMQVADMTGRTVIPPMSLHDDVTYTLSTAGMAGGIYIATLLRDGNPIQSLKLVKE